MNFFEHCEINILVVPVHVQRHDRFDEFFRIISNCNVISCADLVSLEDNIYFNFTRTLVDPALDDLFLSNKIYGVIGVINCEDVEDLEEALRDFVETFKV